MRLLLFVVCSWLLLGAALPVAFAEAIPVEPPPTERPAFKKRLKSKYKKRRARRRHPQRHQATADAGTVFLTIVFSLLAVASIGASIWGFFLFFSVGAVVLLIINLLLDLIIFLLAFVLIYQYDSGIGILITTLFWISLKVFTWGALFALPGLWIPGLIVLSMFVLLIILGVLFVILLANTSWG